MLATSATPSNQAVEDNAPGSANRAVPLSQVMRTPPRGVDPRMLHALNHIRAKAYAKIAETRKADQPGQPSFEATLEAVSLPAGPLTLKHWLVDLMQKAADGQA